MILASSNICQCLVVFSPCSFCQSNVCAAILNSRISQQTVITHDAWCCGKAWSNSCLKHILQSCVPHSDLHCDLARISDRYNLVLCQWRRSRQPTGDRKSSSITAAEIQGVQGSLRISWHTHTRARANTHTQTHRCKSMDANTRARVHTHMLMRTALYACKREHTCVQTNLISRMV